MKILAIGLSDRLERANLPVPPELDMDFVRDA